MSITRIFNNQTITFENLVDVAENPPTILGDADKFYECVNKEMVYMSESIVRHGDLYFDAKGRIYSLNGVFLGAAGGFAANAISSRDNKELPSHNLPMITADIYGQSDQRFRNCMTIGCGKAFKFQSEDDFTCPDCRQERAEMERRQGVEGDLLNANKVFR